MKISQLKNAYKNLSLIIYKSKYLIPNKPIRPLSPYLKLGQTIRADLKNNIQQSYSSNISRSQKLKIYHKLIKEKIQTNDPIYIKIKEEYDEQNKKYQIDTMAYKQQYLDPPTMFFKYRPYNYFGKKIIELNKKLNKKTSFKEISQKWSNISNQQKQKLAAESNVQMQKNLQFFRNYVDKHKIPIVKAPSGLNIFVSDQLQNQKGIAQRQSQLQSQLQIQKQSQVSSPSKKNNIDLASHEILQKYEQLPQTQKIRYQLIAQQRKQISQELYNQFLKKWGITHQELQHIKKICKMYEASVKISKQSKKNMKSTEQEQQQHENYQEVDNFDIQQLLQLQQEIPTKQKNSKKRK